MASYAESQRLNDDEEPENEAYQFEPLSLATPHENRKEESQKAENVNAVGYEHYKYSSLPLATSHENWTKISDPAERRRISNRIALRNYRKKLRKRLEDLESRAGEEETKDPDDILGDSALQVNPDSLDDDEERVQTTSKLKELQQVFQDVDENRGSPNGDGAVDTPKTERDEIPAQELYPSNQVAPKDIPGNVTDFTPLTMYTPSGGDLPSTSQQSPMLFKDEDEDSAVRRFSLIPEHGDSEGDINLIIPEVPFDTIHSPTSNFGPFEDPPYRGSPDSLEWEYQKHEMHDSKGASKEETESESDFSTITERPSQMPPAYLIDHPSVIPAHRPSERHVHKTNQSKTLRPLFQCAFWFLCCDFTTEDQEEWRAHCLSHFRGEEPPQSIHCGLCDEHFHKGNGWTTWDIYMDHLADHYFNGQNLGASQPNYDILRYLWSKRLINDADYIDLQAGKPPSCFLVMKEGNPKEKRARRVERLAKEKLDSKTEPTSMAKTSPLSAYSENDNGGTTNCITPITEEQETRLSELFILLQARYASTITGEQQDDSSTSTPSLGGSSVSDSGGEVTPIGSATPTIQPADYNKKSFVDGSTMYTKESSSLEINVPTYQLETPRFNVRGVAVTDQQDYIKLSTDFAIRLKHDSNEPRSPSINTQPIYVSGRSKRKIPIREKGSKEPLHFNVSNVEKWRPAVLDPGILQPGDEAEKFKRFEHADDWRQEPSKEQLPSYPGQSDNNEKALSYASEGVGTTDKNQAKPEGIQRSATSMQAISIEEMREARGSFVSIRGESNSEESGSNGDAVSSSEPTLANRTRKPSKKDKKKKRKHAAMTLGEPSDISTLDSVLPLDELTPAGIPSQKLGKKERKKVRKAAAALSEDPSETSPLRGELSLDQQSHDADDYHSKADLWSVGTVLHEMVGASSGKSSALKEFIAKSDTTDTIAEKPSLGLKIPRHVDDENGWWIPGAAHGQKFQGLAPKIMEELRLLRYRDAPPLAFELFMIGKSEELAMPTIMFCSTDSEFRKFARDRIVRSGVLDGSGFITGHMATQFGESNGDLDYSIEPLSTSSSPYPGSPMEEIRPGPALQFIIVGPDGEETMPEDAYAQQTDFRERGWTSSSYKSGTSVGTSIGSDTDDTDILDFSDSGTKSAKYRTRTTRSHIEKLPAVEEESSDEDTTIQRDITRGSISSRSKEASTVVKKDTKDFSTGNNGPTLPQLNQGWGRKDKRTMLSDALQQANTAVLLDNMQKFEEAIEAYRNACKLLQQAKICSSREDDKHKLNSILITYTDRIKELRHLGPSYHSSSSKSLPTWPMSKAPTPKEQLLRDILEDILLMNVSGSDNFFKLGGDSVSAVRLVIAARKKNINISVADVLKHQTLERIAEAAQMIKPDTEPVTHLAGLGDNVMQPSADLQESLANEGDAERFLPGGTLEKSIAPTHSTLATMEGLDGEMLEPHLLLQHSDLSDDGWKEVRTKLPEAWMWDVDYHSVHSASARDLGCWTCTPTEPDDPRNFPLTIAGAPVIIPVEYQWPPIAGVNPPPDPRPSAPIDCSSKISLETIRDIFLTFDGTVGFYVLLNGLLQLIVPEDFDTAWASSHLPHKYGGLRVSYILQTVEPTMLPTKTETMKTKSSQSSQSTRLSSMFGSSRNSTISLSQTLQLNDFIEARSKSSHRKDKFAGRIGLKVTNGGDPFLIMSSHVITEAILAKSNIASMFSRRGRSDRLDTNWNDHVEIWAGNEKIGSIEKTFDCGADTYPHGFSHDVTLIKPVSSAVVKDIRSPIQGLDWLSKEGWHSLRQQSNVVRILGETEVHRAAKTLKTNRPSEVLVVGEGIFLNQTASPKPSRSEHDISVWRDLVSRALLYRVYPDFDPPNGYSGIALYGDGLREDGTTGPGVVGFQSFVQRSGHVQNFEMEGGALEKRLKLGRVAFYGAFQVPDDLKRDFGIV